MNRQKLNETLNEVTCETLEKTAFMFPEVVGKSQEIEFGDFDFVMASLSYDGDSCGEVMMIVPVEFCIELSSNMLGESEEGIQAEAYKDALKEILNIIVGQLLVGLFGNNAIFNLSAPAIVDLTREEFESFLSNNDYALAFSDEWPIITYLKQSKETHEYSSSSR